MAIGCNVFNFFVVGDVSASYKPTTLVITSAGETYRSRKASLIMNLVRMMLAFLRMLRARGYRLFSRLQKPFNC